MIIYKQGNILDSTAQCLVNPVNCVGISGKGLALEFKRKYPLMFASYKQMCDAKALDIGNLAFWSPPAHGKSVLICLFPTKKHWRQSSSVDIIERGLRAYVEYSVKFPIESVAFPRLGCGLGNLNFELEVQPLMEKYLSHLTYPVEIYTP
jgi:O-acetyl-ADP-ribose deacetylase (regulator of RNase III)